jgi:glycosyltransferase involved in cell wall biosynthesis
LKKELTWVFELPHYHFGAGGIHAIIQLASVSRQFGIKPHIRFQRHFIKENYRYICQGMDYSIGLPDTSFPEADIVLTYSDTPYLEKLLMLPQAHKIAIYMLSYGMAIEREKRNVQFKNVTVFTSSKRTSKLIGERANFVGHSHDFENFYIEPDIKREKIAVILYHPEKNKRYNLAVQVVNELVITRMIDEVIIFGMNSYFENAPKPLGFKYFVPNTKRAEIREIFSKVSLFIMPSVTEGLNLTPIESTLCGCPAVICDGAIGEFFNHAETCYIAEKDNLQELVDYSKLILSNNFNELFRQRMLEITKNYTWENVILNMKKVLYGI